MESPSSAIAGDGVAAGREKLISLKGKNGKPNFLENGWHDYRFMKNGKPRPSAVRDFPEGIVPIHLIQTTGDVGRASPTTSEGKIEQNQTKEIVGASATEEVTQMNADSAKFKEALGTHAGLKPEKALTYSSKKAKAALGEHKKPILTSSDSVKSNGNDVVTKETANMAEEKKSTLTEKKKSTPMALDVPESDKKKDTTLENSENALSKSGKVVDRKTTSSVPDVSVQKAEAKIVKKFVSTEGSQSMPAKSIKSVVKNVSAEEAAEATSDKEEVASLQDDKVRENTEEATTMEMIQEMQTKYEESVAVPSELQEENEQEEIVPQGQTEEAMDVEKQLEQEKAEKVSKQSKSALPTKRKSGVRDLPELKGRKQQEANVSQGQVEAMDVQKQQEKEKVEKVIEQGKKALPIKRKSGIRDLPEPLMQSKNKMIKGGAGEAHLAEDSETKASPSKNRDTVKENSVADSAKLNSSEKKKRPLEDPSSSEKSKKLPKLKPSNEGQTPAESKEREPNFKTRGQVVTPKPTKKPPSTPSESSKKPTPSSSSKKVRRSAGKSVRPATSIVDVNEARKLVLESLRLYDAVRRKLVQDEEKNGKQSRGSRADLQAATLLKDQNASRVGEKVVGSLPGVLVGDIFLFRTELSFARVHGPIQAGIEYLTTKDSEYNSPVAISIISNVGQDGEDNGEELIYTGQGGRSADNKQIAAQKLERGNLALDGSRKFKVPVRVIRGIKDVNSPTGKIYVYDGLYSVEDTYTEKGSGGFDEFKFRLQRLPEQPELGSDALKLAADLKSQPLSSRKSVVIPDISKGKESQAICVENTVDDEKPAEFKYSTRVTYPDELGTLQHSVRCKCNGACTPSSSCGCFSRNGDELPYINGGYLVRQKDFIFECGSKCSCSSSCRNRTTEKGLKFRLDVFKTAKTGWGVRCLEMIPAGSFVCDYVGKVVANEQDARASGDRKYMMFTRWLPEMIPRWGDVPNIIPDRSSSTVMGDADKPELVIDATQVGNVARFINHSCSPNLLVQRVLSEHQDVRYPHFKFFAIDNIPPLRELTFDYGYPPDQESETEETECLCGSSDCRGKLYL